MTERTDKLIDTLAQEAVPITTSPSPFLQAFYWLSACAFYIAALVGLMGLRPDLGLKLQSPSYLTELGLMATMVVFSCISGAALSFPDLHQKRWLAWIPAFPSAAFATLLYTQWQAEEATMPEHIHGMECMIGLLVFSLIPAAFLFHRLRKQASTHPYLTGGIVLLISYSVSALALRLCEQTDSVMHLVQWHYLPMIGVTLAGLFAGRLWLKW